MSTTQTVIAISPLDLLPGNSLETYPEAIIGDSGGRSAIVGEARRAEFGFVKVDVEHGVLVLDEDLDIDVEILVDVTLDPDDIPADHPVRPLRTPEEIAAAESPTTCGYCELTWDDAIVTSMTPAPAARCPFEYEHVYFD